MNTILRVYMVEMVEKIIGLLLLTARARHRRDLSVDRHASNMTGRYRTIPVSTY